MRLSQQRIWALQKMLKDDFGLEYSEEEVQRAGTAILRFVVAKLRKEVEQAAAQEKNNGPKISDRRRNKKRTDTE
jgi:hypothetical protein